MNRYVIQFGISLGIIGLFIIDKSLSGVITFFNFYSITLVVLLILANVKSHRTFIFNFFIFGILADWYNRSFLGVSILVSVIALYLFYVFKIRFNSNKPLMTVLNLIFCYILGITFWGFENLFDIRTIIMSILVTATVCYMWLKE